MKAKLTLLAALALVALPLMAGAATHTVNQVGSAFDPADITISIGDTVEWIWSSSVHTVTNGSDSGDPDVGTLFDDPLDAGNPLFSYTFDSAGDVLYFCRIHEFAGMAGVVRVIDTTPTEDASWGNVKALY